MISSVQAVILIDIKSICASKESDYVNKSKLYLACLRILTELGAKSQKGHRSLLWAYKFYESDAYKPNFNRKVFYEFNEEAINKFETELHSLLKFNGKQEQETKDKYSHRFILNKALQEILQDYNWDSPNISSPVKTKLISKDISHSLKKRDSCIYDTNGNFNMVILFTKLPSNLKEYSEFIGYDFREKDPEVFPTIIDQPTINGYGDEKNISIHIINLSNTAIEYSLKQSLVLNGINGDIHILKSLVQCTDLLKFYSSLSYNFKNKKLFKNVSSVQFLGGVLSPFHLTWNNNGGLKKKSHEPGPILIWEDYLGVHFLEMDIKIINIQERSEISWGNMYVMSLSHANYVNIIGRSLSSSSLYFCYSTNSAFQLLMSLLVQQNLIMILQLASGTLAALSPWIGKIGFLQLFSSSKLSSVLSTTNQYVKNDAVKSLVSKSLKKCLKMCPISYDVKNYSSSNLFVPQMLKSWYIPSEMCKEAYKTRFRKRDPKKNILLERLQKKYRPQMPRPLSGSSLPSPSFIDITEPAAAAGLSEGTPLCQPGSRAYHPKRNISRAQKLVKKSKIVTAKMKVKGQREEELESEMSDVKRRETTEAQWKNSHALIEETLRRMIQTTNIEEAASHLINLKDSVATEDCEDLIATSQSIINLASRYIKRHDYNSVNILDFLGHGVLLSDKEISENVPEEKQCREVELQILLHLEALWVLGYSPAPKDDEESVAEGVQTGMGEQIIEVILRLLRRISLKKNPSAMAEFLKDVVVPNFCAFHGQILADIFEELNLPLPNRLLDFASNHDDCASIANPSSILSYISSSVSTNSNPGSAGGPATFASKMPSKTLLKREPSNRQIVVSRLPRRRSRKASKVKEKKRVSDPVVGKSVCRNLFERQSGKKNSLKRHHTVTSVSSTRFASDAGKPVGENARTPNKSSSRKDPSRKRTNSERGSPSSYHRTPQRTPSRKREKLCVPETPVHNLRDTIYDRQRLRKSTGQTMVEESPDAKGAVSAPPSNRLRFSRRASFYSGGLSRNFAKGEERIRSGQMNEAVAESASRVNGVNFRDVLFSEIRRSNGRSDLPDNSNGAKYSNRKNSNGTDNAASASPSLRTRITPERRQLSFDFGDSPCGDFHGFSNSPLVTKTAGLVETLPSLGTPAKRPGASLDDPNLFLTPSKRVQFSFEFTPSKQTTAGANTPKRATPKSILKTPVKSPVHTPIVKKMESSNQKRKLSPNLNKLKLFDSSDCDSNLSDDLDDQAHNQVTLENSENISISFKDSSQFHALLNSPIMNAAKLKDQKKDGVSPGSFLATNGLPRSPLKKSPKSFLIRSPSKRLVNSEAELELTSPSKWSVYSSSIDSSDRVIDLDSRALSCRSSGYCSANSALSNQIFHADAKNPGDPEMMSRFDSYTRNANDNSTWRPRDIFKHRSHDRGNREKMNDLHVNEVSDRIISNGSSILQRASDSHSESIKCNKENVPYEPACNDNIFENENTILFKSPNQQNFEEPPFSDFISHDSKPLLDLEDVFDMPDTQVNPDLSHLN